MGHLIELSGVKKVFGSGVGAVHALGPVDQTIDEGEFVSFLGPSGCGKSTLMLMIAGLLDPSEGQISLAGRRVEGPQTDIGIMFQDNTLVPWRTVRGNVELQLEMRGIAPASRKDEVDDLLRSVHLDDFADRFPYELSGGMQQRAAIVRALSFDPSVLLMDEPFGALDAFTRDEMNLLVEKIWLETQKTIVFITHNITEAVFLSDNVYVMSARPGRIAKTFPISFPRPRTLDLLATKEVFDLVNEIKAEIESTPSHAPGPAKTLTA